MAPTANAFFGLKLLESLPVAWTFLLFAVRFSGMMVIIPGIGGSFSGMVVRYPAVLALAFAATASGVQSTIPENPALLLVQASSEFIYGYAIGLVPMMMVAGAQMAGFLSGTSMGLGAGNLIDPSLGQPAPDVARILGDLFILMFLIFGGHYAVIRAVAGSEGQLVPGSLAITDLSLPFIIQQTTQIFKAGILISAPVVVALLLTQFMMGLLTKAVPTINVFVVSFPITIGIGLVLTMLSLPEIVIFMRSELAGLDANVLNFAAEFQP